MFCWQFDVIKMIEKNDPPCKHLRRFHFQSSEWARSHPEDFFCWCQQTWLQQPLVPPCHALSPRLCPPPLTIHACGLYNVSLCLGVSTAIISLPHHCHCNHWYSLHLHLEVNLLTVKSTFVLLIYLQNEQENLVLNSTQKQSHYVQTSPKSLSPIK